MTFSRHAAVNGDWLLISEPVDKTPLTFYANALALVFFAVKEDSSGVLQLDALKGEFAGRIPSVLMSILLIAVMMRLTMQVTKDRVSSYLSGILIALSPLRIVFAPTAFTDIPMLLFAVLSLWMATRKNVFWSGIWFVLSLAAKPQSIFYLPLLITLLYLTNYQQPLYKLLHRAMLFSVPVLAGIILLWQWDSARIQAGAESFYLLGQMRYTPTTLTQLHEYPSRFVSWWATVQYVLGHSLLTASLLVVSVLHTLWRLKNRNLSKILFVFWGWLVAFFAAHMILTLNLFDRNLLLIVPVIILLVSDTVRQLGYKFLVVFVIGAMILPSLQAALWQLPAGGDDGRHDGIHLLANHLNSKPIATVIYDRWLDWELDYYMGQWTNKRRVYYPTPQELVSGVQSLDEVGSRYFVAPANINISDWLQALEDNGFTVNIDYQLDNFIVYRMEHRDEK